MKTSAIVTFMAAASLSVAMPSSQQTRSVGDVLSSLKRDTSGAGFTHLGSDNVVRSFDKDFNVVDFRRLDGQSAPSTAQARSPSDAVLAEAKQAKARSETETSKPRAPLTLDARQEKSCPSQFCRDDQMCVDLSVYGYDCKSCLMVSGNVGNCQQF